MFGLPLSLWIADLIDARSTTAGTPVKSCIKTRAGLKFISLEIFFFAFHFEKDSISGLPGVVNENGSYIVPIYDIITPLDRWSNQFKGIRFKIKNKIPLNPSAVPDVSIDTLIWNLPDNLTPQEDSLITFSLASSIFPIMSYTNIASYLRRLNFDYKIQLFQIILYVL